MGVSLCFCSPSLSLFGIPPFFSVSSASVLFLFLLGSCLLWRKIRVAFGFSVTLNFSSEDSVVCSAAHHRRRDTIQNNLPSQQVVVIHPWWKIFTKNYKHPDRNTCMNIHIYCIKRGAVLIIMFIVHLNVCNKSLCILRPVVRVIKFLLWRMRGNTTTVVLV